MTQTVVNLSKLIRGVIAMALICLIAGFILFNPITTSVIGGLWAGSNLQDRALIEVQDRSFMTACAPYKEASTWERWTTPMFWSDGWCEKYLDRM